MLTLDGGSPSRATSTACCARCPSTFAWASPASRSCSVAATWLARRLGSRRSLAERIGRLGAQPHRRRSASTSGCCSSLVIFADEELARAVRRGRRVTTLDTEILIIGSGAGGAVTAATLARAGRVGHGRRGRPLGRPRRGRAVLARRDGPEVPPPGRVRRARHARGSRTPKVAASAAAPRSTAACTTVSRPSSPTSGAGRTASSEFTPEVLDRYADRIEERARRLVPSGRAPAVVRGARARRHQARLAGGRVRPRVQLRQRRPRHEADDGAHDPAARDRRRRADHRRLPRRPADPQGRPDRRCALHAHAPRRRDRDADHPGRARLRVRRRDPDPDAPAAQRDPGADRRRAEVPPDGQDRGPLPPARSTTATSRCTASPSSRPFLTIGGSASRRGHVALALADSATTTPTRSASWENVVVYYAAIRSDGSGRVIAHPGTACAARDVPDDRRGHEPPGPRPAAPRRGAARGGRNRAVPVGRRRHRGRAGRRTSSTGGTRSHRAARTS